MNEKTKLIDTGSASAAANMQMDADLLSDLAGCDEPILHLYDWEGNCATYGYFINPEEHLNTELIADYAVQIARRPTGGGIVFHHCDFAFSFLLPASHPNFSLNTLENYAFVNHIVIDVIRQFCGSVRVPSLLPEEYMSKDTACAHFCMAKPTIYDVMLEGRKVGGAAQRRTKAGFLHQGSIALQLPSLSFLSDVLKHQSSVMTAMQQHTYPLLGYEDLEEEALIRARRKLRQLLIDRCAAS